MRPHLSVAAAAVALVSLAGCVAASGRDAAVRRDVEWPAYGGGVDTSQYSPLAQIDRGNVASIEPVWSFALGSEATRANPIMVDGTLYTATDAAVLAIDAVTGASRWRHEVKGLRVRGVIYWSSPDGRDQRIIFHQGNNLVAVDARTGRPISAFLVDLREGLGRDPKTVLRAGNQTPGRIFEDMIIVGSSPGEDWDSPPGDIRAYDVRTGERRWSFHTIPHPGEFGYDSYPPDAWKTMGGNNNWGEMTVDPANSIVFVPLASPNYDFWGVNRPGDNLFGSSLVALDARTGKRLWHFQTVHHDIWDYDLTNGPKLLTLMRDGKPIEAVAQATKNGFIYTFERKTGRPVFPIVEKAFPTSDVEGEVTAATQPIPVAPPPFARQHFELSEINPYLSETQRSAIAERLKGMRNEGLFTPPSIRGTIQMPGHHGGAQYGNVAIDPRRGRLYVVSINIPTVVKLEAPQIVDEQRRRDGDVSGRGIYAAKCGGCHQADRSGQPPAIPSLQGIASRMSVEDTAALVRAGRGLMPAVKVDAAQLTTLLGYLGYPASSGPGVQSAAIGAQSHPGVEAPPERDVPATTTPDPIKYKSAYTFMFTTNGQVEIAPPWATLSAYDMNKGELLWRIPFGDNAVLAAQGITGTGDILPKGTLVATASGLLISTTQGGKLMVWDADNGKVLLARQLAAEAGGIPAVYSIRGRQYLVVPMAGAPSLMQMLTGKLDKATNNALVAFALPAR